MAKVFLSHNSADKPMIRRFRAALAPHGPSLWLDEVEMLPGDSLFGRISEAVTASDRVLVFVSAASVKSKWVQRELFAFLAKEDQKNEIAVIPVVLDETPPPPFLSDRLQIRLPTLGFAGAVQQILKGILRQQSVILLRPDNREACRLVPFLEELKNFIQEGEDGTLRLVYDHYAITDACFKALVPDEEGATDRLLSGWPRCMDFLAALSTRLIQTVLVYWKGDLSGPAQAEKMVQLAWRLLFLRFVSVVRRHTDLEKLNLSSNCGLAAAFSELDALEASKEKYVPKGSSLGCMTELWLQYLNAHVEKCHDIGFAGRTFPDGRRVNDANHVYIRQADVREQSLVSRDVEPDAEFSVYVWVCRILPFIAADAVFQAAYAGLDVSETVPRVGLRKDDFVSFGWE